MASKRIIILDKLESARTQFRVVLWADVPAARQAFYANPQAVSAWKDALPADVSAIQSGAVAERVIIYSVDGSPTIAAIQSQLETAWTAYQAEITARNPWNRYGSNWDGVTWTLAGAS
jgi:hypothetical protein